MKKDIVTEIAIGLFCLAMLFTTGCVKRTYRNQSFDLKQQILYDIEVESYSFSADKKAQNLNGVFGDGAYFGVSLIESEINTMAIEAVAEALKSPLLQILRGGL